MVIAVAQEDADLKTHGQIREKLKQPLGFEIVADIGRQATQRYKQTTAYLIDRDGIVREIFPMTVHHRASWRAILNAVDRLKKAEEFRREFMRDCPGKTP